MKIAFCKFAGLANGGTEKYLQTLAMLYKSAGHEVDYYYTNAAKITSSNWVHPDNDDTRMALVKAHGINLKSVHVEARHHNSWINHNFYDVYSGGYDFLITAGNGEEEEPYNQLRDVKIIHTIHGFHAYNQPNIVKSVCICNWQAEKWLSNGGDPSRCVVIPPLVKPAESYSKQFRRDHGIEQDAVVVGFHQRDGVGVTLALEAYDSLSMINSCFIILGGSEVHQRYVNGKNVLSFPATSDVGFIHSFLSALDVYAHSRYDGEVCSASIIEAMYHGLPIITHVGYGPNYGHLEQVDGCGVVTDNVVSEYADEIRRLYENLEYRKKRSESVKTRYNERYDYDKVVSQYLGLLRG